MAHKNVKDYSQQYGGVTITTSSQLDAQSLSRLIEASLDDDKAEDIAVISIAEKCSFADYMIVASGRSQRHVGALADKLQQTLRHNGVETLSVEGTESCEWVLIDAGNIIVHLFHPERRDFYRLEEMWSIPMATIQSQHAPQDALA